MTLTTLRPRRKSSARILQDQLESDSYSDTPAEDYKARDSEATAPEKENTPVRNTPRRATPIKVPSNPASVSTSRKSVYVKTERKAAEQIQSDTKTRSSTRKPKPALIPDMKSKSARATPLKNPTTPIVIEAASKSVDNCQGRVTRSAAQRKTFSSVRLGNLSGSNPSRFRESTPTRAHISSKALKENDTESPIRKITGRSNSKALKRKQIDEPESSSDGSESEVDEPESSDSSDGSDGSLADEVSSEENYDSDDQNDRIKVIKPKKKSINQ